MSRLALLSLAMCAPLLSSGCVAVVAGAAGAVGVSAAQDRSMGQALDDSTLSNDIKTRLLSEEGFGEVDVEVAQGLVLLSGRVNTPEQRVRAEDIAWSAPRTQDVANEINIEPAGGFLANAADELVTARVRASLMASKTVKSINYNIETYNGVVYLMGIARSQEELKEAAERASVVTGVKRVVSYVRVSPERARPSSNSANTGELAGGPATN